MSGERIFCPGAMDSQTGVAVRARYPHGDIQNCGSIASIPALLDQCSGPFVVPIWNSHAGEVKAAEFVWNSLTDSKIKISDIWPSKIEFSYVTRRGAQTAHHKVGSVTVARQQCSEFLTRRQLELVERGLTTIAYEEYRNGASWDGVLVAPGQGEKDSGYRVVTRHTANPNNFTSFVKIISSRAFRHKREGVYLTGVAMRPLERSLGEAEQAFFERLLERIETVEDIPRLLFVIKRTSKVGLLFEGARLDRRDLLAADDIDTGDISVFDEVGVTSGRYAIQVLELCAKEFPRLLKYDFLLHRGVNTCLFGCPPLGLFTHGFEIETVEPVVRFYINKLFELWDSESLRCTEEQEAFFRRHKRLWMSEKSRFMTFVEIGPEGKTL